MSISTPKRLAALALLATIAISACSSGGGASAAVSAAATVAPTVVPTAAASTAASAAASAAASSGAVSCVPGSITASGSTAMQPVVEAAAAAYKIACPAGIVSVQGGGSGTGLAQVASGAVNIGNSDVTAEEKIPDQASTLVNHIVLKQGWVMVVNSSVTGVTNLTTQQASDIWTGAITNWSKVGGPDQAIVLILRPASSGTRATFKKIVLAGKDEAKGNALTEDSNGAVAKAVGTTPGSTSYIGLAYYQANKAGVTPLQLDGVEATPANITNGTYKLSANGNMYTKGEATGLSQAFIAYMLGPEVQGTLIPKLYYAPVK